MKNGADYNFYLGVYLGSEDLVEKQASDILQAYEIGITSAKDAMIVAGFSEEDAYDWIVQNESLVPEERRPNMSGWSHHEGAVKPLPRGKKNVRDMTTTEALQQAYEFNTHPVSYTNPVSYTQVRETTGHLTSEAMLRVWPALPALNGVGESTRIAWMDTERAWSNMQRSPRTIPTLINPIREGDWDWDSAFPPEPVREVDITAPRESFFEDLEDSPPF